MKTIKKTFKSIKLPTCQVVDREKEILKQCFHKKVLHLGSVDAPITEERVQKGQLLHLKIMKVAKKVVGIDNSQSGIKYLRKQLGIDNIIYGDVQNLSALCLSKDFDIIVAGELLEHLSNPGLFLENLRVISSPKTRVIITVPNAFSIKSFLRVFFGKELVHPDHMVYYSIRTISTLIRRFGFKIATVNSYLNISENKSKRFLQIILHSLIKKFHPWVADGLIFEIKLEENAYK